MTDTNRLRLSVIKEVTLGTLPASPRMRTARITGESLSFAPGFFSPAELRADRMNVDPTKISETNDGGVNFEWSFPAAKSALSAFLESAMLSTWIETNERDNDGTADSVITDIDTTPDTLTFTTGTAFVIGQLVQTTGFAEAANNAVVRVTTGGATSLVATGSGWEAQSVPPAAARVKVVGCQGVAGDIVATGTGLTCTTLSFTAVGIVVGMWIKIGGTAVGDQYATAANNGWARVTAVSATAITLDNRPAGWTSDVGGSKTIKIWFGDIIRNGTTLLGLSMERSFLGQGTPTHILQKGMCVDRFSLDMTSEAAITGALAFMGLSGSQGTSANGNTYAAATTGSVMTSNVSVGSISLDGTDIGSPNWARSMTLELANNLRMQSAVGNVAAVGIGVGEVAITGTLETYFGSNTLYASLLAGTPAAIATRATANGQATIKTLPRVTFTGGSPNAGGKNQDVLLPLSFQASIDTTTTNAAIDIQRLQYFE